MGGKIGEAAFSEMIIAGAEAAGTLGGIGDGADPAMYEGGVAAIKAHGGLGAAFIKPRGQDAVVARIRSTHA